MKVHTWLIIAIALGLWGCAEKEAAQPAAVDEAPAAAPEAAVAVTGIWEDEAFVAHMHEHADKLDELNFALADGDLDAAKAHADWLANHDTNADIQSDWMPFLFAMRAEAEAVAAAPDIESAQAAAERITVKCQECHAEAGVRTRL
jgi:hypothetical protein